jgi:hypothetical protein
MCVFKLIKNIASIKAVYPLETSDDGATANTITNKHGTRSKKVH